MFSGVLYSSWSRNVGYVSGAISPVKPAAPLPSLPVVPKKAPPPAPKKEKKTYTVFALYHFQRAEEGDLSLVEVF